MPDIGSLTREIDVHISEILESKMTVLSYIVLTYNMFFSLEM